MEDYHKSRECHNCGVRFLQSDTKKRRRYLLGQEDILQNLNFKRRLINKPPLDFCHVICHGCYRGSEYGASSRSTSSVEDDEMDISDIEAEEAPIPGPCPISSVPSPQAASTSHFTPSMYPNIQIVTCAVCPLVFEINPNVPCRQLGTAEFLRVLLNGERHNSGQPFLTGHHLICDPCFFNKMQFFSEQWRLLNQQVNLQIQQATEVAAAVVEDQPPIQQPFNPEVPAEHARPPQETPEQGRSDQEPDASEPDMSDQDKSEQDESEEDKSSNDSESESMNDSDTGASSFQPGSATETSSEESDYERTPPPKRLRRDNGKVTLPIASLVTSGNRCCICFDNSGRDRIDKNIRTKVWMKLGLYIKNENRTCAAHINPSGECGLTAEAFELLRHREVKPETSFKKPALLEFITSITEHGRASASKAGKLSFSGGKKPEEFEYKVLLSISSEQFDELFAECEPHLHLRKLTNRDGLAVFLMKLRLNLTLKTLGVLFGVNKSTISRTILKVKKVLLREFVPKWLGYQHMARADYIGTHTTDISKVLTQAAQDNAIVVIDGTYLYFQKSRNYKLQRRMYSMHKFRNLLKVMMVVSTTGYILAIEGPFFGDGSNNDSNIMRSMARDANGFRSFFMPGDYIIEDRGFRDSNTLMANLGYSLKMPHFLGRRPQHPTSEANESRLVTKIRWVVESVNGRLKNVFRMFRDVLPNTFIKKNRAYEYFQIGCALLNAFHPPLAKNKEGDKTLAEEMLTRSTMHNLFMDRLKDENFIRSTKEWKILHDTDLMDFPRLSRNELRHFTYGVYQIHQAPSYIGDSADEMGSYDIFYHPILGYDPTRQGNKSITGWYCKCPNGSRVVGCCAHIAAVLWYLCYARYLGRVVAPGADLATLVRDAPSYRYEEEFLDIPTREEERLVAEHLLRQQNEDGQIESESAEESDSSSGSWLDI